jgi:hypothetical protein
VALPSGSICLANKACARNAITSPHHRSGRLVCNIPAKRDCHKGFAFSSFLYLYRNLVARCFGKRTNARGSSNRYDKQSGNLPDAIKLFCTRL